MVESLAVTLLPVLFLVTLFGGGAAFRRRNIDIDGKAPISKLFFYSSKYMIVLLWGAAVARAWGADLSTIQHPSMLVPVSLGLWTAGFLLLFIGRLGLGSSFRIGSPRESTALKTGGLFAISRNPMYVGVYATLFGSMLYTANALVLIAGIYVIAVHHWIVLAEEAHLKEAFGSEYADYCRRVRRYL